MPDNTSDQLAFSEAAVHSGITTLDQMYLPLAPAHIANPYTFYARTRQEEPVFFSTFLNAWIVTRYEDVMTVLKDTQRFGIAITASGAEKLTPEVLKLLFAHPLMQAPMLVSIDPPEHTRLRRCLTKAFSAQRIANLEPDIRKLANNLINRVASWGQMDFRKHLAGPYPIQVIGKLLNVPEVDMDKIQRDSEDLMTLLYAASHASRLWLWHPFLSGFPIGSSRKPCGSRGV